MNFSESSELNLFLLILEGRVSNQLRMVHLENFQFLVSSRKFGLELLTFKRLDFLDFINLPFVDFIELSGSFGACLLDLILELLDLIIMRILHVLHIFLVLRNLRF